MLFNLSNASARARDGIEAQAAYQVEGFILNTPGGDPTVARELARHGKPAVLVDRRLASMPSNFVSLDNADAVRQAFEHLSEHGWKELLYVTERIEGVSPRIKRAAAFVRIIAAHKKEMAGKQPYQRADLPLNQLAPDGTQCNW